MAAAGNTGNTSSNMSCVFNWRFNTNSLLSINDLLRIALRRQIAIYYIPFIKAMWFAVACLTVAVRASPSFKDMEGQYKLVGAQRPSTHGQLFASLPITRNLIFSAPRIEVSSRAVEASVLFRPSIATGRQKSEADLLERPDGGVGARATRNIATPRHFNWNEWLGGPGNHGRLPRNMQRRSIGRRFCDHLDCERVALAHRRRGEFGQKRLDTRGTEVSRVSDE